MLVKTFNEVVGNVVLEALNSDVPDPENRLYRDFVSRVAVGNNGIWLTVAYGFKAPTARR